MTVNKGSGSPRAVGNGTPLAASMREALAMEWPSWHVDALCMQVDPEMFFPETGGSTKDAKELCWACPVQKQCLTDALSHEQRFGVWGGYSERERRAMVKAHYSKQERRDMIKVERERRAKVAAA